MPLVRFGSFRFGRNPGSFRFTPGSVRFPPRFRGLHHASWDALLHFSSARVPVPFPGAPLHTSQVPRLAPHLPRALLHASRTAGSTLPRWPFLHTSPALRSQQSPGSSLSDLALIWTGGDWFGFQVFTRPLQREMVELFGKLPCSSLPSPPRCRATLPSCLAPPSSNSFVSLSTHASTATAANGGFGRVREQDSWLHLVEDDVSWMRAHAGNWLTSIPHPFEPDRALDFARQQPKTWKRAVRQATCTSICQARLWSDLAAYRKQVRRLLCEAGATFHVAAQPTAHQDLACPDCRKTFSDVHRLRMHRTVQHKVRSEAASYAESTHCPICLVEFWSTQRLLVHFRSPSKHRDCLQVAQRSLLPCDPLRLIKTPVPSWLVVHKRVRGVQLAGPREPTAKERADND